MHLHKEINLRRVKAHMGYQSHGFEELCCQMFSKIYRDEGTYYRRPRGGDGGAEAVFRDANQRVVAAVQAKFSEGTSVPWSRITGSILTTLQDNQGDAGLRRYIVAVSMNVRDDKWLEHKQQWQAVASSLGYKQAIEFELWTESHIHSLLLEPMLGPQRSYWFDVPTLTMDRCAELTQQTISRLEKMGRYFKAAHTAVSAEEPLRWFARTEHARRQFVEDCQGSIGKERSIVWKSVDEWPEQRREQWHQLQKQVDAMVSLLGNGTQMPSDLTEIERAGRGYDELRSDLFDWLWEHLPPTDEARNDADRTRSDAAKWDRENWSRQAEGSINWPFRSHRVAGYGTANAMLVRGDAGGGKTHLLAEFCARFLEAGGPVFFTEGAQFMDARDARDQLATWLGLSSEITFDQFLDAFDALALASDRPGLLCIDGMNESSHRKIWKQGIDHLFNAIRKRPNLKLLVSCRTDYIHATLPESLRGEELPTGWRVVKQDGLGDATFEAMTRYLDHYKVKGTHAALWRDEFRNPLFLKIYCEAYEESEPPTGSQSFTALVPAWANAKAKELLGDDPSSGPRLHGLLAKLGGEMAKANDLSLSRSEAVGLIRESGISEEPAVVIHSMLNSEVLGNYFTSSLGAPEERVRFVYEKVTDYFMTSALWPLNSPRPADLGERIQTIIGQQRSGILEILALRLPEEEADGIELPDVNMADWVRTSGVITRSFLRSLPWRTQATVTESTGRWMAHLLDSHRSSRALDHLLPLAAMPEFPWNADYWDKKLRASPFMERESWWTNYLNHNLQWSGEGAAAVLKDAGELPAPCLSNPKVLELLCTTLSWMQSTTHSDALTRITLALARLLEGRLAVATRLVEKFADVDDAQIIERVLYATAHAAAAETAASSDLACMAQLVFARFISCRGKVPNTMLRYYASVVVRAAEKVGAWEMPQGFVAPKTEWPELLSEADEAALDQLDPYADALSSVAVDTRTKEQITIDKWWIQISGVCHRHEDRRLSEQPHGKAVGGTINQRWARRYILKRVQEHGLLPGTKEPWASSDRMEVPRRPQIDRLGKKLQRIALHEFAGHLEDHFHPSLEHDRQPVTHEAPDYRLESFFDPYKPLRRVEVESQIRLFVPEAHPWFVNCKHPFPAPLTDSQRERFVLSDTWADPTSLLEATEPSTKHCWVMLEGHFSWNEPMPCWRNADITDWGPRAKHEMAIRGAFVPSSWLRQGSDWRERMMHGWLNDTLPSGKPLVWLREYPDSASDKLGRIESRRGQSASSASVYYSSLDNEPGTMVQGYIPSPLIAKSLGLKWKGDALDFQSSESSDHTVIYRSFPGQSVCLIRRDALEAMLTQQSLVFVWQIWGCRILDRNASVQRKVWAAVRRTSSGEKQLVCGRNQAFGVKIDDEGSLNVPWVPPGRKLVHTA